MFSRLNTRKNSFQFYRNVNRPTMSVVASATKKWKKMAAMPKVSFREMKIVLNFRDTVCWSYFQCRITSPVLLQRQQKFTLFIPFRNFVDAARVAFLRVLLLFSDPFSIFTENLRNHEEPRTSYSIQFFVCYYYERLYFVSRLFAVNGISLLKMMVDA